MRNTDCLQNSSTTAASPHLARLKPVTPGGQRVKTCLGLIGEGSLMGGSTCPGHRLSFDDILLKGCKRETADTSYFADKLDLFGYQSFTTDIFF